MEKLIIATRVLIAVSLAAIALKFWTQPEPVSRKDFLEIAAMKERGVTQEEISNMRKELYNRIPYVYVNGGSVNVD